jgi:hypothetical protein
MNAKRIKELYQAVKQFKTLCDPAWPSTCISLSTNFYHGLNSYIRYKHYGSSSIKCNLKDFTWLIKTIFNEYDDLTIMNDLQYNEVYDNYLKKIKP